MVVTMTTDTDDNNYLTKSTIKNSRTVILSLTPDTLSQTLGILTLNCWLFWSTPNILQTIREFNSQTTFHKVTGISKIFKMIATTLGLKRLF